MKLLRIVRSEDKGEVIKFIEISDQCTNKEFSLVLQHLFGNSSTIGLKQILNDSSGKPVYFEELQSGITYFLTFDKRSSKSFISWESTQAEFIPSTNSSKLRVLDESQYYSEKIKELKLVCKDKATDLVLRQEDSLVTLKQSLAKIHSTLGSQSLRVLEYSASTKGIVDKIEAMINVIKGNVEELRKNNSEMRQVYSFKMPAELVGRRKMMDPRILNYMKRFNYKDLPMNELTPAELKRFVKFQIITENQIKPVSSQNTPSSKRQLKLMSGRDRVVKKNNT